MNRARVAGIIFGLFLAGDLTAFEPLSAERALDRYTLTDVAISPDGRRVAFVVSEPPTARSRTGISGSATSTVESSSGSRHRRSPTTPPAGLPMANP